MTYVSVALSSVVSLYYLKLNTCFIVHFIVPFSIKKYSDIVFLILFFSFSAAVNEFRNASDSLIKSHFRQSEDSSIIGRVEYLPVNWHNVLHGETTGVDK